MTFRKMSPGDLFEPTAAEHNAMVDAAIAHQAVALGRVGHTDRNPHPERLQLRCVAHATLPAYSAATIADVMLRPEQSDDSPQFALATPVIKSAASSIARTDDVPIIFAHGVKVGEIGTVVTSGVCGARLKVNDAAHRFARPGADDQLETTGSTTPIRIIWKPDTDGVGIVHLGSAASGAAVFEVTAEVPARSTAMLPRIEVSTAGIGEAGETEAVLNLSETPIYPPSAAGTQCDARAGDRLFLVAIQAGDVWVATNPAYAMTTVDVGTALTMVYPEGGGTQLGMTRRQILAPSAPCDPGGGIPVSDCDA